MQQPISTVTKDQNLFRQYFIITANYWAFTLTDGALRMLVLLHFHALGYKPLDIALLFIFYEFFGVITNLFGGWLGARFGLNRTMHSGLFLQVLALSLLLMPTPLLSVAWVMIAQALSGIAKDLNKMSAKSAVKLLIPDQSQAKLYRWVALLTGSKNTLKGVGFFLGAALLSAIGFQGSIAVLILGLLSVCIASIFLLKEDLGKTKNKPKFKDIFSSSQTVNQLAAARLFLFSSRDVWFSIALPVYLSQEFSWNHWQVGSFIALWIIGYGVIQGFAPIITGSKSSKNQQHIPDGKTAFYWALLLCTVTLVLALCFQSAWHSLTTLLLGLVIFGGYLLLTPLCIAI